MSNEDYGIKKANAQADIVTKEEYERRVREIVKCKRDIVYFANTYFKILSLNGKHAKSNVICLCCLVHAI